MHANDILYYMYYYFMLLYIVLYYAMLYRVPSYHVILYNNTLNHTNIILYHAVSHYTILILYHANTNTIPYCSYHTISHYIMLYHTISLNSRLHGRHVLPLPNQTMSQVTWCWLSVLPPLLQQPSRGCSPGETALCYPLSGSGHNL